MRFVALCFCYIVFTFSAVGQVKAAYSFCVQSEEFESFKATMSFTSIDFGVSTARILLQEKLESKLNTSVRLSKYTDASACGCASNACKEITLSAVNQNGAFKIKFDAPQKTGAQALGTLDKLVSETKKAINNPKEVLKDVVEKGIDLLNDFFD